MKVPSRMFCGIALLQSLFLSCLSIHAEDNVEKIHAASASTQSSTSTPNFNSLVLEPVLAHDYADFLNHVAATDPDHLYEEKMGSDSESASIVRLGTPGNFHYEVIAGRENFPVRYVSDFNKEVYSSELNQPRTDNQQPTTAFLSSNQNDFEIDAAATSTLTLAATPISHLSSSNDWSEVFGVLGIIGVAGFAHELMMMPDDQVTHTATEVNIGNRAEAATLSLQRFHEAAVDVANVGARRLVLDRNKKIVRSAQAGFKVTSADDEGIYQELKKALLAIHPQLTVEEKILKNLFPKNSSGRSRVSMDIQNLSQALRRSNMAIAERIAQSSEEAENKRNMSPIASTQENGSLFDDISFSKTAAEIFDDRERVTSDREEIERLIQKIVTGGKTVVDFNNYYQTAEELYIQAEEAWERCDENGINSEMLKELKDNNENSAQLHKAALKLEKQAKDEEERLQKDDHVATLAVAAAMKESATDTLDEWNIWAVELGGGVESERKKWIDSIAAIQSDHPLFFKKSVADAWRKRMNESNQFVEEVIINRDEELSQQKFDSDQSQDLANSAREEAWKEAAAAASLAVDYYNGIEQKITASEAHHLKEEEMSLEKIRAEKNYWLQKIGVANVKALAMSPCGNDWRDLFNRTNQLITLTRTEVAPMFINAIDAFIHNPSAAFIKNRIYRTASAYVSASAAISTFASDYAAAYAHAASDAYISASTSAHAYAISGASVAASDYASAYTHISACAYNSACFSALAVLSAEDAAEAAEITKLTRTILFATQKLSQVWQKRDRREIGYPGTQFNLEGAVVIMCKVVELAESVTALNRKT